MSGASLAQVMTFLIASPWNSITLTFILISLIGLKLTLLFIVCSAVIAIATGLLYKFLVEKAVLPGNPNEVELPEGFDIKLDAKERMKGFKINRSFLKWQPY